MQLIADRFVVDARGQATDLATGERVCLTVSSAGGTTEQAAWAERCAWFSMLAHRSIAPLLDYGVVCESNRFEAWGAEPGWRGAASATQHAELCARRFLTANGRTAPQKEAVMLGVRSGRAVVVPDAGSGLVCAAGAVSRPCTADRGLLGVLHPPDRRLAPLAELLVSQSSERVAAVAVWVPEGGGAAAAVRVLARAARLGGAVPVDASRFDADVRRLVRGRTLVLMASGDADEGWRALLDAALDCARPHAVYFVGSRAVRRVHTVSLERASVEALVSSVCPAGGLAAQDLRRVSTAARRAQGLRGRFERLLFAVAGGERGREAHGSARRPAGERAAEELVHTVADQRVKETGQAPRTGGWPAPGELIRLVRQLETASLWISAGRHEPGERLARQVMHAFARRGEWVHAANGVLALARSLRRRGRGDEAAAVLAAGRPWATSARDLPRMQAMALLHAELLVDAGSLVEAEAVLDPLLGSVVSSGSPMVSAVVLSFARCLFWQGRYADAWHRLALSEADAPIGSTEAIRLRLARSYVLVGRGRVADAVALAARAREDALVVADERLRAEALQACALAQLAAGDAREARSAAERALLHARAAREPLLVLSVRILRAEASRRLNHRREASVLVGRYGRMPGKTLPATFRARLDLLRDLLGAGDEAMAVERRADASGLPALRLLGSTASPASSVVAPAADDIVGLLQCCQEAQDERAVLSGVCGRLRGRLRAAGAAFFATDAAQPVLLASDGARPDGAVALRVVAANQLVLPHDRPERPEAGVPVRYAGRVIGALVVTWMPAAQWHAADVTVLLSTGAAAAGPALSALMVAKATERLSRTSELIGVSAATAEVRASIERAAGAPFSVLVEGESGSGKELVARLLHKLGPRRDRPFCTLNCAALPDDLVESELFGHARGAFTGAVGERRGVIEEAHTGTLFLDEIGELSQRAQAKLLRAIQESEIRRVGENICRRVDVRLITATNRDLRAEAAAGRFRLDLLYRLDVIRIVVPPLRQRRDDIAPLIEHVWREATGRVGSQAVLAPATVSALVRHEWPGNVRELQNVLASLVVRCPKRGVVPPSALPSSFAGAVASPSLRLDEARETFDREFIRAALVRTGGRRTRAARELGVSRQGLAKLMARLEMQDEAVGAGESGQAR